MLQKQAVCDIVLAVLDCMSLRLLLAVAMPKQVFLLFTSVSKLNQARKATHNTAENKQETQQTDTQPEVLDGWVHACGIACC